MTATPPAKLGIGYSDAYAAWELGHIVRYWPLRDRDCVPVVGRIQAIKPAERVYRSGRRKVTARIWIEGHTGSVCGTHCEVVR